MRRSGQIAEYLDALTRELRFDPDLGRRLRCEVEDHLTEAISESCVRDPVEAEQQVIERFGDPRDIARHYAPLSLVRQARRVGAVLIVAIAAILVLMKGRSAMYELLQWRLGGDGFGITTIGPMIDRYAFEAAMLIGVLGWCYIASCRVTPSPLGGTPRRLKRYLLLPLAATGLLLAAVVLDAILGGLRLIDAQLSLAALVPVLSIAIELALIGIVAFELRNAIQCFSLVAALLANENSTAQLR
jgi:hypothetical protein